MSTPGNGITDTNGGAEPPSEVVEGPHSSRADVAPEMSQLQNQPHGPAGQPENRPAHEGHQGITPIQPDSQLRGDASVVGESPRRAFTHGDPPEIVDTAYTGLGSATSEGAGEEPAGAERVRSPKSGEGGRDGSHPRDESKR